MNKTAQAKRAKPRSEANDFEREVEMLRKSKRFVAFLGERSKSKVRIPHRQVKKELGIE